MEPIPVSLDPLSVILVVMWLISRVNEKTHRAPTSSELEKLVRTVVREETSPSAELAKGLELVLTRGGRKLHATPVTLSQEDDHG